MLNIHRRTSEVWPPSGRNPIPQPYRGYCFECSTEVRWNSGHTSFACGMLISNQLDNPTLGVFPYGKRSKSRSTVWGAASKGESFWTATTRTEEADPLR